MKPKRNQKCPILPHPPQQNLDEELERFVSNDLVIQNNVFLCKKALHQDNMKNAIMSSYCQVGVYLFNSEIVLQVIKKSQVHLKNEDEEEQLKELKMYLENKICEHNESAQAQLERKAAASTIKFSTKTAKILTFSICLGRIRLATEWKKTKTLPICKN